MLGYGKKYVDYDIYGMSGIFLSFFHLWLYFDAVLAFFPVVWVVLFSKWCQVHDVLRDTNALTTWPS